jgi:D-tyrosyl-tRNA(Tyr) deacylase
LVESGGIGAYAGVIGCRRATDHWARTIRLVRAVVQRVRHAIVSVAAEPVGSIGPGLLVLVGVTHDDRVDTAGVLARKIWHLRIFPSLENPDDGGRMERSVADVGGEVCVVSQFTLYGDTRHGRRPSWTEAAPGAHAEPLVEAFVTALRELGARVATGRFGATMAVESVNEGPVTLLVEA